MRWNWLSGLAIAMLVALPGWSAMDSSAKGSSKGRILMIIAPKNFRDEELLVPKRIFQQAGYEVVVASREKKTCVGMLGAKVMPDITIDEIDPKGFDAVVLVGGVGAQTYFNDKKVQDLLNEFYKQGKLVSAICLSPVTLANAGLLKGKEATVWHSEARRIEEKGAKYRAEAVVSDGGIVTGSGPSAAEQFARQVLRELELMKEE